MSERLTVDNLSKREKQILRLAISGKSNREIAEILAAGKGTVDVHICRISWKLGIEKNFRTAVRNMVDVEELGKDESDV